jgi:hypothetical protein
VEPGVTDFYDGENIFTQVHAHLQESGFWLSKAIFQKNPRISVATREQLKSSRVDFALLSGNPTAVEAQYFRTLGDLESTQASIREYVCLWILAMLNSYHGFALDVGVRVIEQGLNKQIGALLVRQTLAEMGRHSGKDHRLMKALKSVLPRQLRPIARKAIGVLRRK